MLGKLVMRTTDVTAHPDTVVMRSIGYLKSCDSQEGHQRCPNDWGPCHFTCCWPANQEIYRMLVYREVRNAARASR